MKTEYNKQDLFERRFDLESLFKGKRIKITTDSNELNTEFEGIVIGMGIAINHHPLRELRIQLDSKEIVSPTFESIIKLEIIS